MRGVLRFLLPGLMLMTIASETLVQPAFAQKAASAMSVKIGYFNLNLVRVSDTQSANPDQLKTQAEEQLKRDLEEGNKKIQKLRDEKKPEDEIKKTVSQLQIEMNAKHDALVQLVQNNNAIAQDRIRAAVNAVAKERGLDIVIDAAGVYGGGQKVVENGVDITEDVVRKLNPNASSKPAAAATK